MIQTESEYSIRWVVAACDDVVGQVELGDPSGAGATAAAAPLVLSDGGQSVQFQGTAVNYHRVTVFVQPGSVFSFSAISSNLRGVQIRSDQFVVPVPPKWKTGKHYQMGACIGIIADSSGNTAVLSELTGNLLQPELWTVKAAPPPCNHGNGLDLFVHLGSIAPAGGSPSMHYDILGPLESGAFSQTTPMLFLGATSGSSTKPDRTRTSLRTGSKSSPGVLEMELLNSTSQDHCSAFTAGSVYIVSVLSLESPGESLSCASRKLSSAASIAASFLILVLPAPPDREFAENPAAAWLDEERQVVRGFIDLAVDAQVSVVLGSGSGLYQRSEAASAEYLPVMVNTGGGGADLETISIEHRVHEKAGFVESHSRHHAIIADVVRQPTTVNSCFNDTLRIVTRADDMALLDSFEISQQSPKGCHTLKPISNTKPSASEARPLAIDAMPSSQQRVPQSANTSPTSGVSRRKEAALLRKRMKRRRSKKRRK